ncbi:MAG TPA: FtsQ-type POTRA domain-containing protein [Rectinemataceae bacterium]|nr:FtsQ-type POTRA domain-containing protein [Rectinemataceae bacterium]
MTEGLARKAGHRAFVRIANAEGRERTEGPRGRGRKEEDSAWEPEDDFPDIGEARPSRSRRSRVRGEGKRGGRRLLVAVAVSLAVSVIVIAAYYLPASFVLRRIEVSGATTLAAKDLIAASRIVAGSPLFSNDLRLAERNLEAWAPVARARVRYALPDAIRLEIVERKAVAFTLVNVGASMLPVEIDEAGYAFAKAGPGELPDLPVISGIRFEGWAPGMRLPDYLLPTLASIGSLGRAAPALLSLISEIRVERTNWGKVELLLFPLHHAVPVRTGPRLDADLLRSIVLVLDALDKGGVAPTVGELDFRSGTIVFRSKEGRSG